jgi:flavin-dependent dehydrogenase
MLEARVVVAADGLRSLLGRHVGLELMSGRRRYGVNAHILVDQDAGSRVDVHFRRGYEIYVTPVGERLVNVALLCNDAVAKSLGGGLTRQYRERVAAVLKTDRLELADEPSATGPFPAVTRQIWRRNLILAGDAAGFCDGITGEGISIALRSARLAAEAVGAYLGSGSSEAFARYGMEVRRLRRPSELFARLILALAARPVLARYVLRNLSRRPGTFSRLVSVNAGELSLRDLRPKDLLGLALGG